MNNIIFLKVNQIQSSYVFEFNWSTYCLVPKELYLCFVTYCIVPKELYLCFVLTCFRDHSQRLVTCEAKVNRNWAHIMDSWIEFDSIHVLGITTSNTIHEFIWTGQQRTKSHQLRSSFQFLFNLEFKKKKKSHTNVLNNSQKTKDFQFNLYLVQTNNWIANIYK